MTSQEQPWWERPPEERYLRCGDFKSPKTGDVHRNKAGEPCGFRVAKGATACTKRHGGKARHVQRKTKERAELQKAEQLMERYTGEFKLAGGRMNIDPTQALQWLLESAAMNVAFLEAQVRELHMGSDTKFEGDEQWTEGLWSFIPEIGYVPTPWKRMYDEERDKLNKYSMDCIKAGVAEIMVRTATDTVQRFIDALEASWTRLGLTPEQKESERKLIAQQLQGGRHIAKDLMRDAG